MTWYLLASIILLWGQAQETRKATPHSSPALLCPSQSESRDAPSSDKKKLDGATPRLYREMARLEREIAAKQQRLEALKRRVSTTPIKTEKTDLTPATVMFTSAGFEANIGTRDGVCMADILIVMRPTDAGLILCATGKVNQLYPDRCSAEILSNLRGVLPEYQVYILSPSASPYALWRFPLQQSDGLPSHSRKEKQEEVPPVRERGP